MKKLIVKKNSMIVAEHSVQASKLPIYSRLGPKEEDKEERGELLHLLPDHCAP